MDQCGDAVEIDVEIPDIGPHAADGAFHVAHRAGKRRFLRQGVPHAHGDIARTPLHLVPELCSGTHLRETLFRVRPAAQVAKKSFPEAGSQTGVWEPGKGRGPGMVERTLVRGDAAGAY